MLPDEYPEEQEEEEDEEDEPNVEDQPKPICFSPVAPAVWKSADHASHLLWLDIVREEDEFPCHEIYAVRLDSAKTADRDPKFFAAAVLPGDQILYYLRLENPAVNGGVLRYPCYFIMEDRTYPIPTTPPMEEEETEDTTAVPVLYPFKLIKTFTVSWDESTGVVQLFYWTNEKIVSYDPGVPEWDLCEPEPSDGIEPFADQRVKDNDSEDIPVVVEPVNAEECETEEVQRVLYYAEGRPYLVETWIEGRPEQEQIIIFNRPVLVTYPGQFGKTAGLFESVQDAHICCTCCPPTPEKMQPGQTMNAVKDDYESFEDKNGNPSPVFTHPVTHEPVGGPTTTTNPVTGAVTKNQPRVLMTLVDALGKPIKDALGVVQQLFAYNDKQGSQTKAVQQADNSLATEDKPVGTSPPAMPKGQNALIVTDQKGNPKISAEPGGVYSATVNSGAGYTTGSAQAYIAPLGVDSTTGEITKGPPTGPVNAPFFTGETAKLLGPYTQEADRVGSPGTLGTLALAKDGNAAVLVSAAPYATTEIGTKNTPSATLRTMFTRACDGVTDPVITALPGFDVGVEADGATLGQTNYTYYETILFFDTGKLDTEALGTVLGFEVEGHVADVNNTGDLNPNKIALYDENYAYTSLENVGYPHVNRAMSRTPKGPELKTVDVSALEGEVGNWYSFGIQAEGYGLTEAAKNKIPRNAMAIFSLRPVTNATGNGVPGEIVLYPAQSGFMEADFYWDTGDPAHCGEQADATDGTVSDPASSSCGVFDSWTWETHSDGYTFTNACFAMFNTKGICPSGDGTLRVYVDDASLTNSDACTTLPVYADVINYPDYPDDGTLPAACWSNGDSLSCAVDSCEVDMSLPEAQRVPRVFPFDVGSGNLDVENNTAFRLKTDCACADPGFEGVEETGSIGLDFDWTKTTLTIPTDEMELFTFRDVDRVSIVTFDDFRIKLYTTNFPNGTEPIPVDGIRYTRPTDGSDALPPFVDEERVFQMDGDNSQAISLGEDFLDPVTLGWLQSDGTVMKAQAVNNIPSLNRGTIGFVDSPGVMGAPVSLKTRGRIDNTAWDGMFTPGSPLFISTTPGELTDFPPAALSRPVAFALDSRGSIFVNTGPEAYIHVRKNSGDIIGSGRLLNFIEGPGIQLTITQDTINKEIDIQVNTSGFGTSHTHNYNKTVTPVPDGLTSGFTVSGGLYTTSSLEVYVNGLHQVAGSGFDFIETVPGSGQFEFQPWAIPDSGEVIRVSYLT